MLPRLTVALLAALAAMGEPTILALPGVRSEGRACWTVPVVHILNTIDGDTVRVRVAVWHDLDATVTVRVLDVDTPELRAGDPGERLRARQARDFTTAWMAREPAPMLWTCRVDHFGRVLGKLYRGESVLADDLKRAGFSQ